MRDNGGRNASVEIEEEFWQYLISVDFKKGDGFPVNSANLHTTVSRWKTNREKDERKEAEKKEKEAKEKEETCFDRHPDWSEYNELAQIELDMMSD